MRLLVAPQELKGTLSARQATEAIALGLREALPEAKLDLAPLADGGPGTVDALVEASKGVLASSRVKDPLGRDVEASWGVIEQGKTAVLEMAAASGLSLLGANERAPLRSNTWGTGELIARALGEGCNTVLVGVGGSATNDGGLGAASALGVRFLDESGVPLLEPRELTRLARIDLSGRHPGLARSRLVVLTDVANPLLGPQGASVVFAPQKGADEHTVQALEAAMRHLSQVARTQLGIELDTLPGAGAAGGLAYGLCAFCNASLKPGFQAVAEALHLEQRVRQADWVLTAEGRLDAQSSFGKGPVELARMARHAGRPVAAFVGFILEPGAPRAAFDELIELSPGGPPASAHPGWASKRLEEAARSWGRAHAHSRA